MLLYYEYILVFSLLLKVNKGKLPLPYDTTLWFISEIEFYILVKLESSESLEDKITYKSKIFPISRIELESKQEVKMKQ